MNAKKKSAAKRSLLNRARSRAQRVLELASRVDTEIVNLTGSKIREILRSSWNNHPRLLAASIPTEITVALRYLFRKADVPAWYGWSSIGNGFLQSITIDREGEGDKLRPFRHRLVRKKLRELQCLVDSLETYLDQYLRKLLPQLGVHNVDDIRWTVGFLQTLAADYQRPHGDFGWDTIRQDESTSRIARSTAFMDRVPFVLEFALTSEGLSIEFFPEISMATTERDSADSPTDKITGSVTKLDHGEAVLFRGDVVHAGGFKSGRTLLPRRSSTQGSPSSQRYCVAGNNLRCHIYIYQARGIQHQKRPTTHYRGEDGKELLETHQTEQHWRRLTQDEINSRV